MTRDEFGKRARAHEIIRLSLPRRLRSVRVGFGGDVDRAYAVEKRGEGVPVRSLDFIDYSQIAEPSWSGFAFNIETEGVTLPLIRLSADPAPEILFFTCEPATICVGERTVPRWATRNVTADAIEIDRGVGSIDSRGSVEIYPPETTCYTLRLAGPGADDATATVTVTVLPPFPVGGKPRAVVNGARGRWRYGSCFNLGEIETAGSTAADARKQGIAIDKRRTTSYSSNM